MNIKLLAPAVVVIAVVAIAAAVVFAGGGDDGDDTAAASPTATSTVPGTIVPGVTPSPTPTLETTPDPTPTPVQGPEARARNFELVEAPAGLLEFVTDGPYVVPGDAIGAFYLNIETQQIEGWYALIEGTQFVAFSGEGRFTLFWRKEQVLNGGTIYPAGFYLADRGTRTVYRWDGDAEPAFEKTASNAEIAARGDLILFRIPGDDGDASWYSLLDLASGEVEAAFEADAQWAFISGDASQIALLGQDVLVADVATEAVETVAEDVTADLIGPVNYFEPGKWADVEFVEAADGESFVITANDSAQGTDGAWLRIEWEGGLLAQADGARAYASPDGELVAVAEAIAATDINVGYHSFAAYRTKDGEPVFRVVGVDESYPWPEHDRWLADGSGLVVQLPGNGISLAMEDGSFRDYIGVPSPDSTGIFAAGRSESASFDVVDASGNPIASISFQGSVRDFVDPWGDSGDEVRILIPHGGHGGSPASATIVEPYVEEAPYDGEPMIQLSEVAIAFGLLDLFDEPAGEKVVGQVLDPHRVTVHELAMVCSGNGYSDPERCPHSDSTLPYEFMALVLSAEVGVQSPLTSYWARVTTPDGQEGWILLQTQPQGI